MKKIFFILFAIASICFAGNTFQSAIDSLPGQYKVVQKINANQVVIKDTINDIHINLVNNTILPSVYATCRFNIDINLSERELLILTNEFSSLVYVGSAFCDKSDESKKQYDVACYRVYSHYDPKQGIDLYFFNRMIKDISINAERLRKVILLYKLKE